MSEEIPIGPNRCVYCGGEYGEHDEDCREVKKPMTTDTIPEARRMYASRQAGRFDLSHPLTSDQKSAIAARLCKNRSINANGCWEWTGNALPSGYGVVCIENKKAPVHRLSYAVHKGPIPLGLQACHHCDNRICFHPDHIFIGTAKDNIDDCIAKGRWKPSFKKGMAYTVPPEAILRGDLHPGRKLDSTAVNEIRERLAKGETCTQLAAIYGVSDSTIGRIKRRKLWGSV